MEQLLSFVWSHFLHANRPHPEVLEGPTSLGNALGPLHFLKIENQPQCELDERPAFAEEP
jgi:hypothetical protein